MKLWDVATGQERATLPPEATGYESSVSSVAFSPDGTILASGIFRDVYQIKLWDVATRRPLQRVTGHSDEVQAIAFSPDGALLVCAAGGRTVATELWQIGEERR